jgi:hypothetical protein
MGPRKLRSHVPPDHRIALRLITVVLACVLLQACAGGQSPVGRLRGALPTGSDAENAPEIFVIRSDASDYLAMMLNAPSHKIVIDGSEVFMLAPWRYTNFHVSPGEHRIGIKCFGGWSESWKEEGLTAKFEENSRYYFNTRPSWQCAAIGQVDETEGHSLMKASRHIPFEYDNPLGSDPSANYPRMPRWDPWGF